MYRDVMRKTKRIIPDTATETTITARNHYRTRYNSDFYNVRNLSKQVSGIIYPKRNSKDKSPARLQNGTYKLKKYMTDSLNSLLSQNEDYHDVLQSVRKINMDEEALSDRISLNNNIGAFRKKNIDSIESIQGPRDNVNEAAEKQGNEENTEEDSGLANLRKRRKVYISNLPITPTESKMEFLAALDPLEPMLSLKDNIEKQQTKATIPAVIKNFTPDDIGQILKSITNDRVVDKKQYTYLLGFMNELENLQPQLVEYNLKLIKTRVVPNDDALCCLLRIIILSDIKWPSDQSSIILNTLYDLNNRDVISGFNTKGVIHTSIEALNPREMAYFYNYLADNKAMPTEKYIYLSKYIERLSKLPCKQTNEYLTFLRLHGFIDRVDLQSLLDFVLNTRTHWKPYEHHNLETILRSNLKQKINVLPPTETAATNKLNPGTGSAITVLSATVGGSPRTSLKPQNTVSITGKPQQPVRRKRKSVANAKDIVAVKPIVHHYNTRDLVYVMTNLLMDAPLNNQKLEVIRGFINELLKMVDGELQEYLMILKKRNVITDRICGYLRNLLQSNILNIEANARQLLIRGISQVMSAKYGKWDFPSIVKYCNELQLKDQTEEGLYFNNVTWKSGGAVNAEEPSHPPIIDLQNLENTVTEVKSAAAEEQESKDTSSASTSVEKSLKPSNTSYTTNTVAAVSTVTKNRINATGKEHNYFNENYLNRTKTQKMSPTARDKLNRLFLRLKTGLYFSQRLKFYQKMFRH